MKEKIRLIEDFLLAGCVVNTKVANQPIIQLFVILVKEDGVVICRFEFRWLKRVKII